MGVTDLYPFTRTYHVARAIEYHTQLAQTSLDEVLKQSQISRLRCLLVFHDNWHRLTSHNPRRCCWMLGFSVCTPVALGANAVGLNGDGVRAWPASRAASASFLVRGIRIFCRICGMYRVEIQVGVCWSHYAVVSVHLLFYT